MSQPRADVVHRIAVLHGPNLNLLGVREPDVYGRTTLAEIDAHLAGLAAELGLALGPVVQESGEGAMLDAVHAWRAAGVSGGLVNAGAYTHTSLALRDALVGVGLPFVEVHLSNIYAREPVRRHSMLAEAAVGVVCGFGAYSYSLGLRALAAHLAARHEG